MAMQVLRDISGGLTNIFLFIPKTDSSTLTSLIKDFLFSQCFGHSCEAPNMSGHRDWCSCSNTEGGTISLICALLHKFVPAGSWEAIKTCL